MALAGRNAQELRRRLHHMREVSAVPSSSAGNSFTEYQNLLSYEQKLSHVQEWPGSCLRLQNLTRPEGCPTRQPCETFRRCSKIPHQRAEGDARRCLTILARSAAPAQGVMIGTFAVDLFVPAQRNENASKLL